MTDRVSATVYIATSLDGFIARGNGELDWLQGEGPRPAGEDYGYAAFMESVDAIVMGRGTYEKVLSFDAFLEAGAIQRLIITRIPVLIGSGIALFGPLTRDIRVLHVDTRSYPAGLVQSEYTVVPEHEVARGE